MNMAMMMTAKTMVVIMGTIETSSNEPEIV